MIEHLAPNGADTLRRPAPPSCAKARLSPGEATASLELLIPEALKTKRGFCSSFVTFPWGLAWDLWWINTSQRAEYRMGEDFPAWPCFAYHWYAATSGVSHGCCECIAARPCVTAAAWPLPPGRTPLRAELAWYRERLCGVLQAEPAEGTGTLPCPGSSPGMCRGPPRSLVIPVVQQAPPALPEQTGPAWRAQHRACPDGFPPPSCTWSHAAAGRPSHPRAIRPVRLGLSHFGRGKGRAGVPSCLLAESPGAGAEPTQIWHPAEQQPPSD